MSILFTHPGLDGLSNYAKVNLYRYYVPAWTWEELKEYNALLTDDLKLAESMLISRYSKFGGVPRFTFTNANVECDFELRRAIASFSASDLISYATGFPIVQDRKRDLSSVLKMVPSREDFRAAYYVDFQSEYIAEKVIAQLDEGSVQKVCEAAIGYKYAGDNESVKKVIRFRNTIYKMLCHRWFSNKQQSIYFRALCGGPLLGLDIPGNTKPIRFTTLDEIREVVKGRTYDRPTSNVFDALDAFIVDGDNSVCYGLLMTVNLDHGIKAAPLSAFLTWLKHVGIPTDRFYLGFVVPRNLVDFYNKQTIRTDTNEISQQPGTSASVKQFVAGFR